MPALRLQRRIEMKRLVIRLGISLASGMGLTLALLWLLGNPRSANRASVRPIPLAKDMQVEWA
jgi:hypothetical protein